MYKQQYFISGKVQGVGFRFFTEQIANNMRLKGFVKNLNDGRVEIVVFFNTKEQMKKFEKLLKNGNKYSNIDDIEKQTLDENYPFQFNSFKIYY
ncbi:acylphosphatase (plasmid) [Borreliella yangtzensis]|uniref:acylphosphatase n=1 Tax=Borreliella yangtzensis TaxID=683292 RepID=A0ABR6PCS1_9SPIR|nr:acylphosphatase [Borreliella yangtzensis]MBB6043375.1 acylphosphatase [Borreliella yangtzensis]WKC72909.1 acylphosphatase [Borreliella yangtzensis]WKC73827.1 acylphosphatase [Borreliella yangtzensis]